MEARKQEESASHSGSIWAPVSWAVQHTLEEGLSTSIPVSGNTSTHSERSSPVFCVCPSPTYSQVHCHTTEYHS